MMKNKEKTKGTGSIKYKGKTAVWYWVILIIVNGMCMMDFWGDRITEMLIYVVIADFVLVPPVFRNYLVLTRKTLTVAFGFGKDEIDVKDIVLIKETRNPIAAGALSLDRMEIRTGQKTFICAIKNKEEFYREIKKYNRKIVITQKEKKKKEKKS